MLDPRDRAPVNSFILLGHSSWFPAENLIASPAPCISSLPYICIIVLRESYRVYRVYPFARLEQGGEEENNNSCAVSFQDTDILPARLSGSQRSNGVSHDPMAMGHLIHTESRGKEVRSASKVLGTYPPLVCASLKTRRLLLRGGGGRSVIGNRGKEGGWWRRRRRRRIKRRDIGGGRRASIIILVNYSH